MGDTNDGLISLSAMENIAKFIRTSKGKILSVEMVLCFILIICKATSNACYLWTGILEMVWAVITFIVYALDLHLDLRFFTWTDISRGITGSIIFLTTSLLCLGWGWRELWQAAGSVSGLLAAGVFGYDAATVIKQLKQQGSANNDVVIY